MQEELQGREEEDACGWSTWESTTAVRKNTRKRECTRKSQHSKQGVGGEKKERDEVAREREGMCEGERIHECEWERTRKRA